MKNLSLGNLFIIAIVAVLQITVSGTFFATLLPPPDPFKSSAVTNPTFTPITYSIQTFLWWDDGIVGTQLDWVENLFGFTHIKHTLAWRNLEPRQGEWDFSESDRILNELEARNIQLIARLGQVPDWATDGEVINENTETHDSPPNDLDAWANYCRTIAERYQGRIAAYQIWNEPNLVREWGNQPPNAEAYVEVLRVCSEAIREVDSAAILISAGLSPTGTHDDTIAHRDDIYLDAMYRAGFQQYIDVVGVHAPGYSPPAYGPDDAERDGRGRWASFRRVEDLRKIMIQHDDAARQMAIMEFGWTIDTSNPDYSWFAVTQEKQAQYIVEAYQYAYENWRPWVGLMSLIYLHNPQWTENDEELWWSLTAPGKLRPAYYAVIAMDKYCGNLIVHGYPYGTPEEVYLEQSNACP